MSVGGVGGAWGLAHFGEEVAQCRHGMVENHARTGVFHHQAYFLAVGGGIAVCGAFAAAGLVFTLGTVVESAAGVVEKCATVVTQSFVAGMMPAAIDGYHTGHDGLFTFDAGHIKTYPFI